MPCTHEFGILDELDKTREYNDYEPHKYQCISVDDDVINDLHPHLLKMKTYFHSFTRPAHGLAYWGVTIIPPESLPLFYDVVTAAKDYHQSSELRELAAKILQAKEQNKHMIHYGV
ncbi:short-chain dehydrogenase [Aeribacillus sp. FSL K6-8210]|uniref:short-chain dehydrogenase n=1 Tax=unclassified Aeribacillus TaxID=2640495 RepID=UPI0030CCCEE2